MTVHPACYFLLLLFSCVLTNINCVISIPLIFWFPWAFFHKFLVYKYSSKDSVIDPESGEPMVAPSICVKNLLLNLVEFDVMVIPMASSMHSVDG